MNNLFAGTKQNNVIVEKNHAFEVKITIDRFSRRIWVHEYAYRDPGKLLRFLNTSAASRGLEKIIFPVRKKHVHDFLRDGFAAEGWADGFFSGEDGCFLVAYQDGERCASPAKPETMRIIKKILRRRRKPPAPLPGEYGIFIPQYKDITMLVGLYKQAFSSYPSPVDQPDYLAGVMGKTALFRAAGRGNRIISAAAAEIDRANKCAELTNCATVPENRGGGLMSHLVAALEKDCLERGIHGLYSLARASSYGMNLVFHRLGYRYRGTLFNNCHIGGGYENMNIWAKFAPRRKC